MESLKEKEVLDDADDYTDELKDDEPDQNNTVSAARKKEVAQHHKWKAKAIKKCREAAVNAVSL